MNIPGTTAAALPTITYAASEPTTKPPAPVSSAETQTTAEKPRELGLKVLQAEIRQVLSARLKFSFGTNGYESAKLSAAAVAGESLSAAGWLLREAPLKAAEELSELRDDIEDAAEAARELVPDDDLDDVEEALGRIDDGFDGIGKEAARNTESSASVLAAEAMIKQRSVVRIRTQDGDVVTLKFRQRESFSAMSSADESGSATQLEMSSRSRMDLRVRGELDDGELQAIKAVFERAQEIAGSFFGGDLAEAFSKASELEFDRSELAKVKMKFREQEVSRIQFTQTVPYPTLQPAVPISPSESPEVVAPDNVGAAPNEAPAAFANDEKPVLVAADAKPAVAVPESEGQVAEQSGAIERFVLEIRNFLRSTTQGFEKTDGQRYFYSESFKLSLLKSVFEASAPEQSGDESDRAVAVVNALNESD